jgi:SAM-dependent methyltransferase
VTQGGVAMGTSSDNLDKIRWLYDQGHFRMPAAIADIGCQQFSQSANDSVRTFVQHFGRSAGADGLADFDHYSYMGDLYRAAGFDYVSIDIVDAPYVHHFDLNTDQVPRSLRHRFDLVINAGTTEHVLNQLNALKTIHDLAKPGGLIYSMFLLNGFGPHGLLRYCSRFVELLAAANKYEVIFRDVHSRKHFEWRREVGSNSQPSESSEFVLDECEWVVLKKTSPAPFAPMLDV